MVVADAGRCPLTPPERKKHKMTSRVPGVQLWLCPLPLPLALTLAFARRGRNYCLSGWGQGSQYVKVPAAVIASVC